MPSNQYAIGLTGCCEPFKLLISDFDGSDIVSEFKEEIGRILDNHDSDLSPVPVYFMRGSLGNIRVDSAIIYVCNGVPFILDPGYGLEGGGIRDRYISQGNLFLSGMYEDNNNFAYSLGYVDRADEVYEHAVQFTRTTPLMKNADISDDIVSTYVASNVSTVQFYGQIQRAGGSIFDVYGFTSSESALIRSNKDYMGGEPYVQNGIPENRIEVILHGGIPSIVPVGSVVGSDGTLFTAWVPNDARMIDCARNMISRGDIDSAPIYVDYGDLNDAYEIYASKLIAVEEEADREDESDVPEIDYTDIDLDETDSDG